jgi:L-ascorbate metabolism protein UlaG (beta-lactamase superfamily)
VSFNSVAKATVVDTFKTKNGADVKITFIKHSSLMIDYGGKIVQIDPVSDYADYKRFPKADFVFITHEHSDHFDRKAVEDSQKDATQIILNPATRDILGSGLAMKNGDKKDFSKDFGVEAAPAYNITVGREKFHPKGRDNGYVFDFDGLIIYVAGDTENIPEMRNIRNVDVAFLPVNQPYTMTVAQAVDAALMLRAPVLYPYHYGATDVKKVMELLKNERGIEVRIREMQ